jgi:hypothetical protein
MAASGEMIRIATEDLSPTETIDAIIRKIGLKRVGTAPPLDRVRRNLPVPSDIRATMAVGLMGIDLIVELKPKIVLEEIAHRFLLHMLNDNRFPHPPRGSVSPRSQSSVPPGEFRPRSVSYDVICRFPCWAPGQMSQISRTPPFTMP